jgi:hypothetical protein
MSHKPAFFLAVVALLSAVGPAGAATLYLNGVSPSATETVTFPGQSAITTPYVGPLNWTFNRSASDNALLDTLVPGTSLTTYCIEGTQDVYLGQNATFSSILTGVIGAPQDNVGSVYAMDATRATLLSKFWDAYYSQSLTSGHNAATFQLAVWEIVNDGGITPDFDGGNFKAVGSGNPSSEVSLATTWLTTLNDVTPTEHYQLYALTDARLQDQVFGVEKPLPVPLPAALPVGLAALAGMGVVRHIRRKRALAS